MRPEKIRPRKAFETVMESLADTRVVAINGARQAGKSTLAEMVAHGRNASIRFLDDRAQLQAAQKDPIEFVRHDGLLVIDEVQYALGDLMPAIKNNVDRDPRPGRFLLTGSAGILKLKALTDALPGRMEVIEVWPFSQGEIDCTPDRFVDAAFTHGTELSYRSDMQKRDYLVRVVRGGFPEALLRTQKRRERFFDSYLTGLIERDIKAISDIERHGQLRQLLSLLAGRSATPVNLTALSHQTGVGVNTVSRYLALLEAVFLIHQIPAWSTSETKRATGRPKTIFVDSGLACHLVNQDETRLAAPTGLSGPMMENFVLSELARQLSWSGQRAQLGHYRTKDGIEVDAILESPDGRVVAIEVKAGTAIRGEDLTGLRHLETLLGDRLLAGYLLYTGSDSLSFGGKIRALPLAVLWNAEP